MASLKSQIINFLVCNRHLFQGRLKPEIWDMNTSIPAFRRQAEKSNARIANQLPEGVEVSTFQLGGMKAEWLTPHGANHDKVILYAIGGGYISGSCNDSRQIVAKIAKVSGIPILIFEHRNAPEDPYPAALEDALQAYQWLLAQGNDPQNIVLMGASAGGGLVLASLLALRDQNIPLPVAAVAISPWTDLKLTGESHRKNEKLCISPPGMSRVCSKHYVGDHDLEDPYISPLYGDLRGLPPLFIIAGSYEIMLDDSTRFAEKAKQAGVDVTLRVGDKMMHCYPLMTPFFPEATQALEEIVGFIRFNLRI